MGQVLTHSLVPAAAHKSSSLASHPSPSDAVSELKSWSKREQRRNTWTVNHIEGTKLRMNKRRRPSYRPEDQEAFYRLLGVCSEPVQGQVSSTPRVPGAQGSWPSAPWGLQLCGIPVVQRQITRLSCSASAVVLMGFPLRQVLGGRREKGYDQ